MTDILINFKDKEILARIESVAFEKAADKDFESMKAVNKQSYYTTNLKHLKI